jgi:ornithine cyclodeaminase/alanine dehydrogenase-like protein (mu-crystallin family)
MPAPDLASLPILNEAAVAEVLSYPALVDALERAFIAFSAGEVAQPVRQIVPVPGRDAIIAAMPAAGEGMAVKLVTLYHSNAGTDVPTHQAVIVLFDIDTGSPLALMDGRLITEMRTAATSAVAARALAPARPEVVTIMGSGVQAGAHVPALSSVRSWKELRLWARNPEKGGRLAEALGARFVANAEDAVRDADIVACCTAATEPVLSGTWLKPGAFVSAVGWHGADGRELDDAAMVNTVIVESRDAALSQAGNIRGSGCRIFAEIGEVLSGKATVPEGATVIFDSVGIAVEDTAAATLVHRLWKDRAAAR